MFPPEHHINIDIVPKIIYNMGTNKQGIDMNKNTINVQQIDISKIRIHKYAKLTPMMDDACYEAFKLDIRTNGQLEPVKLLKIDIDRPDGIEYDMYDGRHRLRAAVELCETRIKSVVEEGLSDSDIESQVLSLETRRHQTPTQRAIMAYNYYVEQSLNESTKVSQGTAAEKFGVTRTNLSEVKTLSERAPDLIEFLFNGNKFNIGSSIMPNYTNNLRTINSYLKEDRMSRLGKPKDFKYTESENEFINDSMIELVNKCGIDDSIEIAKRILAKYIDKQ